MLTTKKFLIHLFLFYLCSTISSQSLASIISPVSKTVDHTQLSNVVPSLIQHYLPNADVGIVVMNAQTGKIIYERNSYQPFTPASTTKLFPAIAALYFLKPNYHFKTEVQIAKKQLHHHVLNGDLYLVFSGDPSLTAGQLQALIRQVKQHGIHEIKGNIVIDDNRYTGSNYAPGFPYDDAHWYYAAPVSTVILNENSIPVSIKSAKTLGGPTIIKPKVNEEWFKMTSQVKTVTHEQAEHHCSLQITSDNKNNFTFKGCWPISNNSQTLRLALSNPNLFAKQVLKLALKRNDIALHGRLIIKKAPGGLKTIARHFSPPLSDLVKQMLQHSDNIYADSILKAMGSEYIGIGSYLEGVNAIKLYYLNIQTLILQKCH